MEASAYAYAILLMIVYYIEQNGSKKFNIENIFNKYLEIPFILDLPGMEWPISLKKSGTHIGVEAGFRKDKLVGYIYSFWVFRLFKLISRKS